MRSEHFWETYVRLRENEHDPYYSDNGAFVERMLNAIDGTMRTASFYNRRIALAYEYCEKEAPWALPVLKLIIKNGKNRKESICEMVKIRASGGEQNKCTFTP